MTKQSIKAVLTAENKEENSLETYKKGYKMYTMGYKRINLKRKWLAAFVMAAGLLVVLPNSSKAQSSVSGVLVYNYIAKIGGHVVSTQSGLNVLPGQEIEYQVAVYNTSGNSSGSRVVKIPIPYYADYYGLSYSGGTANLVGDTIVWNLSISNQGTTPPPSAPAATLTYTLVASQDCYALNATCATEVIVTGSISGSSAYFYYDYPPVSGAAHPGGNNTTGDTVTINTSAFLSANCAGKQNREYMYLEGSTTIPVSDISADFPKGSQFFDTADVSFTTPLGSFNKSVPAKRAYIARLSSGCWQKFYINVLDTTSNIFCAGENLSKARYWISDPDAINAGSGDWYLNGTSVNLSQQLTLADSGKVLQYRATALCGNTNVASNGIKIIVHDKPAITQFVPRNTYCDGEVLGARVRATKNDDTVHYTWTFGGVAFGGNNDTVTFSPALTTADNGKWLKVVITNSCGEVKDSIQITVNPLPVVSISGGMNICVGETLQLTGNSNIATGGGSWKSLDPTKATVNSSGLVTANHILGTVDVRYTYISGVGCIDSADRMITINPKPFIKNKTATICSGQTFTVSPVNGTNSDTVPAGTVYTWTRVANANITGDSNVVAPKNDISQTLVNTSNTVQTLVYTVTPVVGTGASSCTGSTFTVTVTINPTPVIANKTATICFGQTFSVKPVNGANGDIVPAGIKYTWTIASVDPNITGASLQSTQQDSISQTLGNTGYTVQTVTYTVTPISGTCTGATFTVTVTVNPKPEIIISGNGGLWCVRDTNRLTVTPTGGRWVSLQPSIATIDANTGLVTAISNGTATIRYIVSTANSCTDSADVTVTVTRLPVLSYANSNNSICVGTTTQLMSDEAGGTWISLAPGIATVDANTGIVEGVAIGTTRFVYTSTTGCKDTTTALTVGDFPSVNPITAARNAVCNTQTVQLTCNTPNGVWSLSDNTIAGFVGVQTNTTATVAGTAVGQVFVTYTVGSGTCQSKSTFLLKVVPNTPPTIIIGFEK